MEICVAVVQPDAPVLTAASTTTTTTAFAHVIDYSQQSNFSPTTTFPPLPAGTFPSRQRREIPVHISKPKIKLKPKPKWIKRTKLKVRKKKKEAREAVKVNKDYIGQPDDKPKKSEQKIKTKVSTRRQDTATEVSNPFVSVMGNVREYFRNYQANFRANLRHMFGGAQQTNPRRPSGKPGGGAAGAAGAAGLSSTAASSSGSQDSGFLDGVSDAVGNLFGDTSLSRKDFVIELTTWFRRAIWFLGFTAATTANPVLLGITGLLALAFEAVFRFTNARQYTESVYDDEKVEVGNLNYLFPSAHHISQYYPPTLHSAHNYKQSSSHSISSSKPGSNKLNNTKQSSSFNGFDHKFNSFSNHLTGSSFNPDFPANSFQYFSPGLQFTPSPEYSYTSVQSSQYASHPGFSTSSSAGGYPQFSDFDIGLSSSRRRAYPGTRRTLTPANKYLPYIGAVGTADLSRGDLINRGKANLHDLKG